MIFKKILIISFILLGIIVASLVGLSILMVNKNKKVEEGIFRNSKTDFSQLSKEELLNLLEEKEAQERKGKLEPFPLKDFTVSFLTYPRQIKAGLNVSFSWKVRAPKGKENTLIKATYLCLVKNLPKKPASQKDCVFLSKVFSGKVSKVFWAQFKINDSGRYYAWALAKIGLKKYWAGPILVYVAK